MDIKLDTGKYRCLYEPILQYDNKLIHIFNVYKVFENSLLDLLTNLLGLYYPWISNIIIYDEEMKSFNEKTRRGQREVFIKHIQEKNAEIERQFKSQEQGKEFNLP